MSGPRVHHPIFARCFDRLSGRIEREVGGHRDRLLAGLSGRVIELGAGNGINFAHYPATVTEVVALEPEPYLRARAEQAARRAPVPVAVVDGVAEELPFQPATFHAAVTTLVLCTVADVGEALAELRRVLRVGGELRFLEHVRSERPPKAAVQRLLDRSGVWPLLGGGCHCARATVSEIEAAGYRVEWARRLTVGPPWLVTNPVALGAARAPG